LSFLLEKAKWRVMTSPNAALRRGFSLNYMAASKGVTRWAAEHVAAIDETKQPSIPLVTAADAVPAFPNFQLWDLWPVQAFDGTTVEMDGEELWVIMAAPRDVHPDLRHDIARLRLVSYREGQWTDLGLLLLDDLNPGSREWAGSTVYDPASGALTLFYTATGRRGESEKSFEQRLFLVRGRLDMSGGKAVVTDWLAPEQIVSGDNPFYEDTRTTQGMPGFIKGFRDPCHFRDPADGADYVLFTASQKDALSPFNGVVGIAKAGGDGFTNWQIMPPLISAVGVNNEMERPIVKLHQGRYYLFWSTQRRTFAPDSPAGPNGLYGMVADNLSGPYRPLNGTGLVVANPFAEPFQTYSWWVTNDFEVAGFVDHWGLEGRSLADNPELVVSQFGGTPAPRFRIALNGDKAQIVTP
jgi:levansucrase